MIHVGISEIKFAIHPESLKTLGLGSCVGVVIYHQQTQTAGMAHVMLPDSSFARSTIYPPGKYADTAIPMLVTKLTEYYHCPISELKAKMAGGAEMFRTTRVLSMESIGKRNIEAVKAQLSDFHIPIISEEIGKDYGRTVEFFCDSCRLAIHALFRGSHLI
ncbi:chemotaxis protein CheD [Sporolactobacillus terrae]|uniref:Probable chemoreceptor glutamine deamidase CheD n=1 Tax=Sporolactobacillus terrae TaxID=269673 RepID=A0A410D8G7_9BACL|nr:chemotaxis protein CheD [Sporolactobacillus terrae]QAA22364.1 chemotaxis protein CheD [Sporolactobacillus terrae]QAA25340.1 chemotaxis protein CheD [Sporolactobacillus terrae]UAK17150.1 chemotaxis protein CheD [Sporolactobacillus terrae]BBN98680.1 chemoreceptor glutamine deamidase CheD [Sporolactobacillus terrae]